jgi:tight adherence protein B
MGAVLGLLVGVGALLIWSGLTRRPSARRSTKPGRLAEELAEAGLTGVRPGQVVGIQLASAVVAFGTVVVVSRSVAVSGAFAMFAAFIPRLLVARLRNRRQAELREVWPEVVDNLTSGVRAGLSLPEALSAVGTRGPEPIREPFRRFAADYRATGRFDDSLNRLKNALANPTGDRVCESLRMAREVGGTDLGRLLGALSAFLREDARTRSELLARQSWSVNTDHRILRTVDSCAPPYTPVSVPTGLVIRPA